MDEGTATRYHRAQLLLGVASVLVSGAYLGAMAWAGGGHALARLAARATSAWPLQLGIVAVALGAGDAVLGAPLAFVRGYRLPRRYGLLHQPFPGWLADRAKAAALSAVFALVAVEVLYALLRTTALWWLGAAAFLVAISVAVAAVFPVWILPLFSRFTPLADEALGARLLRLAARAGIPAVGVFVVDHSRKSRTANAALTGLGRTRRILLYDTLVTRFTADEIESVLAHELGHHVHRDMWRGLAAQAVLTLVILWITDRVLRATAPALGLPQLADPAGLPWLALVAAAGGLAAVPVANAFSRRLERAADDFALAMIPDPGAFVSAMERLGEINLAERRPSRLREVLLHSHPSLEGRISRARAAVRPPGGAGP